MEVPKRIAILGAGPSGLVAAKEALQNGLVPTIFERSNDIGGVWNSSSGAVWNTMSTNISKFTTTFGDFRWHPDSDMFPSARAMFNYLMDYANKWNIRDYIKFNSNVVSVSSINKDLDGVGTEGWRVQWEDSSDETLQTDIFDGVIVATGIFSKAVIPDIPGLSTFQGRVIHSREYKSGDAFDGSRVLTIGGSFSGAEIASDVSNHSAVSYHCFREPFWILRRYLPDNKTGKPNLPIDLLFYNRSFYQLPTPTTTASDDESNVSKNRYMASICQEQQSNSELAIDPQNFSKPYYVTVSDQYLKQIEEKKLVPKRQPVADVNGSTVRLQNGDTVDVDAIIFCTGYSPELNFFDESVRNKIAYDPTDRLQPVILFNECCHPEVKNLFFVGMYKGPYFAVMEQQARLAARVFAGTVSLPNVDVMSAGLQREKSIRDAIPRPQFPHPEYVRFADDISKCANSFPDLQKFQDSRCSLAEAFNRPLNENEMHLEQQKVEIYERFMSEPVTPSHYNLVQDPIGAIEQMDLVQEVLRKM